MRKQGWSTSPSSAARRLETTQIEEIEEWPGGVMPVPLKFRVKDFGRSPG